MHTTSAVGKILTSPKIPELVKRARKSFVQFLFSADNGLWVTFLRIGLGIEVALYAISLKDDWNLLFSGPASGLIGREFSEALLARQSPLVPQLGWLVSLGSSVGLSEWTVLSIAWWIMLLVGCALLVGAFIRVAAILAWFVHLCATASGSLVTYGIDSFMTIGLFYLMLAPLPDSYSLEHRWRPRAQDRQLLGFWRRVLRVHLCFIYFFGGLAKVLGSGWWNGTSLWRALTRSPFNLVSPETLISWKYIFPVAGIAVCLLEISYPFLIWQKRTRLACLISIVAMHAAIGGMMGMYLFALVMIVLNVAAFGPEIVFGIKGPDRQPELIGRLPNHEVIQRLPCSHHGELDDSSVVDKTDERRLIGN